MADSCQLVGDGSGVGWRVYGRGMRNSSKQAGAVAFALAGLLFLGACGSDDNDDDAGTDTDTDTGSEPTEPTDSSDTTDGGGSGGDASITISGFSFSEVTAAAGATVAVTNEDGAPHTVSSDDDAWEEASVAGGASGEITAPSEPGEYAFHCEIHPTMSGTLVVE